MVIDFLLGLLAGGAAAFACGLALILIGIGAWMAGGSH